MLSAGLGSSELRAGASQLKEKPLALCWNRDIGHDCKSRAGKCLEPARQPQVYPVLATASGRTDTVCNASPASEVIIQPSHTSFS